MGRRLILARSKQVRVPSFRFSNVQIYGSFVLHMGEVTEGTVSVGETATCIVDYVRRAPIASNHTMTRLRYKIKNPMPFIFYQC